MARVSTVLFFAVLAAAVALTVVRGDVQDAAPSPSPIPHNAKEFVEQVNRDMDVLREKDAHAAWAFQTDITDAHEAASSAASSELAAYTNTIVAAAQNYTSEDADVKRQLELIHTSDKTMPPSEEQARLDFFALRNNMTKMYSVGEFCHAGKDGAKVCEGLSELEHKLSNTALSYEERLDAWRGWRSVSVPMRPLYSRFVEIANRGAAEAGFADTREAWLSGYDMSTEDFSTLVNKLWEEVRPLYLSLHCYVRRQLMEKYPRYVKEEYPIPAHLLGNMWAQEWKHLYADVVPYPHAAQGADVTAALKKKKWDARKMLAKSLAFFESLGLGEVPASFHNLSVIEKPANVSMTCHASAWDFGNRDVRLKMCIEPNEENFLTLHHELGHIYYYLQYAEQPLLYRQGANDGFHEGIGDTIALSVTPQYLRQIGLLDEVPPDSDEVDINMLMHRALDKVAFLPFGLLVDYWRWDVFHGEVGPDQYNEHWWKLRMMYQGVAAPVPRSEDDFDAGAKFHIPDNTPYMRYFLAAILQFQFHEALCQRAGFGEVPLHRCSIYNNTAAGELLGDMLAMGASKPWQEAMQKLTGKAPGEMSSAAMLKYFAPLKEFLDRENEGEYCGWINEPPTPHDDDDDASDHDGRMLSDAEKRGMFGGVIGITAGVGLLLFGTIGWLSHRKSRSEYAEL